MLVIDLTVKLGYKMNDERTNTRNLLFRFLICWATLRKYHRVSHKYLFRCLFE
jgi:hypothetical protein